jgi:hypothetical protein
MNEAVEQLRRGSQCHVRGGSPDLQVFITPTAFPLPEEQWLVGRKVKSGANLATVH